MKNYLMRLWKNDFNNVFDNMLHKYKNILIFINYKKRTYNLITKSKYYNKSKTFHCKRMYKHLYC